MSDPSSEPPRRPITLDLSTGPGTPGRRTRKGPPPVVVQTINLSTPNPAAPAKVQAETASPAAGVSKPRRDDARRDDARRGRPEATCGGNSLADLLDEATLARLRGGA